MRQAVDSRSDPAGEMSVVCEANMGRSMTPSIKLTCGNESAVVRAA
jgi:hypothetical protein